jgi:hypothetical protein
MSAEVHEAGVPTASAASRRRDLIGIARSSSAWRFTWRLSRTPSCSSHGRSAAGPELRAAAGELRRQTLALAAELGEDYRVARFARAALEGLGHECGELEPLSAICPCRRVGAAPGAPDVWGVRARAVVGDRAWARQRRRSPGLSEPDVEIAVFLCCREWIQHAGRGFDPRTTTHGTGLTSVQGRIDSVAGRVEITAAPGRGTTVARIVPWPLRTV